MENIHIDTTQLVDKSSFHSYFKDRFGFPDYYGNNMDAWIDCMTYIDDPSSGMTSRINVSTGDFVILTLVDAENFAKRTPKLFNDLIDCTAFVNYRRIEARQLPLIFLSFFKQS